MPIDKKFIEDFNRNKSIKEYAKIFFEFFADHLVCKDCNNPIYYYDSTFKIQKNTKQLNFKNKSCLSSKFLDKEYFLCICEKCLTKKYPEYQHKNKSKVFNQLNYLTEYAFNIPEDIALEWRKNKYGITEENCIKKHGILKGKEMWINYCFKQAETNTFEYKSKNYGWNIDDFEKYNKSRAVTLINLIKKHGEDGISIWNKYCEKQRYTTTLNYFIEKHGLENGTEIYNNFCVKRLFKTGYSKVSKDFFDNLIIHFKNYK